MSKIQKIMEQFDSVLEKEIGTDIIDLMKSFVEDQEQQGLIRNVKFVKKKEFKDKYPMIRYFNNNDFPCYVYDRGQDTCVLVIRKLNTGKYDFDEYTMSLSITKMYSSEDVYKDLLRKE